MACDEHISLANKIKSVHLSLRLRAREIGASEAWEEHCKQAEKLEVIFNFHFVRDACNY